MKVNGAGPALKPSLTNRTGPAGPLFSQPDEPLDKTEFTSALVGAVGYKLHKFKAKLFRSLKGELAGKPRPALQRPLVCVQGFRSKPGGFAPLLEHLTAEGQNGGRPYYVKNGQFFLDPECQEALPPDFKDPQARVFRVIPNCRLQSLDVTADQLEVEFEAIREFSGRAKVDVLAHSMGGLSVRRYLDKHQGQLGKLMMVGTPHNGTVNASFAKEVLARDMQWAMSLGGIGPAASAAVMWLTPTSEGDNPGLREMNDRWPQQRQQVEKALTVGAYGYLTPSNSNFSGWGLGDGLVEAPAVELPGCEVKWISGRGTKLHHTLPTDREVYDLMFDFFDWFELPTPANDP